MALGGVAVTRREGTPDGERLALSSQAIRLLIWHIRIHGISDECRNRDVSLLSHKPKASHLFFSQ